MVVVVNADSDSSKLFANWYVHDRKIPGKNVIYLSGIPNRELMHQDVFKDKILKPIFEEMAARKLVNSIDYIVYSSDFPSCINIPEFKKGILEVIKDNPRIPKQLLSGRASISSMTYFAGAVLQDNPGFMMLDANNYYRKKAAVLLRNPFTGEKQAQFQKSIDAFDSEDEAEVDKAIKDLLEMIKSNPQQLAVSYWLAKFYASKEDAKQSAQWLARSIQLGWVYRSQTESDLAFSAVKDDPLFAKVFQAIKDEPFDFVPTLGFKSQYAFAPNGMRNKEPGQGNRHFLSSVLAFTRNYGSTEKDALAALRKTVQADQSKPKGKFYFSDVKGEVRCSTRKPNFAAAAAALERLGQTVVINSWIFPQKVNDIIGATTGRAGLKHKEAGSSVVPGAIVENLTSYGGSLYIKGHTKLTELTDLGAAGSSGTVTEPYAIQAKFPHPMIHAHYVRGCSLAEAFYQSLQGPFQTLVVGDALCQPWATKPQLSVDGVSAGETVSGKKVLKLNVGGPSVQGMELYLNGVMVSRAPYKDTVNFDTKTLTDGYHELRVVVVASGPIESVGHVILPLTIDNFGKSTTISVESNRYELGQSFKVKAKSNFGEKIVLMHNERELGSKKGGEVEFDVDAKELGRGPVKLVAVAVSKKDNKVSSVPVEIEIEGPLSETREDTETKKK